MSLDAKQNLIPGLGRLDSFRVFQESQANYLTTYEYLRKEFGHFSSLYLPKLRYVFSHPDQVRYFLKDNSKNYAKSSDYSALRPLLGEGLLTSEGDLWKKQRALIAPEFQLQRVKSYTPIILSAVKDLLAVWTKASEREPSRDIASDFMQLTFTIAGGALLGSEVTGSASVVANALASASEEATQRMVSLFKFPMAIPTPANLRYQRAITQLNQVIFSIIDERKAQSFPRADVVTRLMKSSEGADSMDKNLLRDEMMTLLMAGHETTSVGLSWTFYLLASHPEIQDQVAQEVNQEVGEGELNVDVVPKLTFTKAVIQEALRLYPPVPAISRVALNSEKMYGFDIPRGTLITLVPWLTQRDRDFWPDPLAFKPDRFLNHDARAYGFAYFPFGAGSRICLGETFAMMEMQMVVASLIRKFRIELDTRFKAVAYPTVTLRPQNGIHVKIQVRERENAQHTKRSA